MIKTVLLLALSALVSLNASTFLSSWNDTSSKQAIINYVNAVTQKDSADFIPPKDRLAVFDNDGTLWAEKPVYFQLYFAMDRVKKLAPQHPEWKREEPFRSVLADDMKGVMKSGIKGLLALVNATHSGMSAEALQAEIKEWLKHAKHPMLKRPYTELVYQPMMELIAYLQANDFQVYIVSGGGIDFMRTFIPEVYGVPANHIIGTNTKVHYKNGHIIKEPAINFIDDKETKPVAIYYNIGKRPVAAFGNSDGDLAMMQYTEANKKYKTLELYVHHTDAAREWKYDRKSHIGQLDKGLDYAKKYNWVVVDMKNDWKNIYIK